MNKVIVLLCLFVSFSCAHKKTCRKTASQKCEKACHKKKCDNKEKCEKHLHKKGKCIKKMDGTEGDTQTKLDTSLLERY